MGHELTGEKRDKKTGGKALEEELMELGKNITVFRIIKKWESASARH